MKKPMHSQCVMRRKNVEQVAWIPEQFAKIGRVLELKRHDKWQDGWEVVSVGETRPTPDVLDDERGFARWRRVTDI